MNSEFFQQKLDNFWQNLQEENTELEYKHIMGLHHSFIRFMGVCTLRWLTFWKNKSPQKSILLH